MVQTCWRKYITVARGSEIKSLVHFLFLNLHLLVSEDVSFL